MKFVFVLAIFIVCAAAVTVLKVKNTRQCKAEGGICKQTCAVDEEDTGSCCRNSNRCCQPPTCIDTLQYAQCKAKNGDIKPVCDVNEQDTGIGPFCNTNRCCEPPTCIAKVDCNCKPFGNCPSKTEYEDSTGNCSGSDICCKPCCHDSPTQNAPSENNTRKELKEYVACSILRYSLSTVGTF
ncbi:unnamed protein product [Mytilus edulis]|uniref:Uncharacterized protein n=1 Tax=Mytilus edulis TaxID=6550 RepID=A0A8S3U7Y9_MYTED|nr:unnamed protein product [Mytilus edulis]